MNIDAPDLKDPLRPVMGGTWGNTCTEVISITLEDDAEDGDVLRFVKLQENTLLLDASIITSAAATTISLELGHAAVDGDGTASDATSLMSATAVNAGDSSRRVRANAAKAPPLTSKPSYIVATVNGTGDADAGSIPSGTVVTLVLTYDFRGHP